MKTHNVTIGIPTYQSAETVFQLVRSLLRQKTANCVINSIIVYSDANTDATIKKLRQIRHKTLTVIDAPVRRGFAYGVHYILDHSSSDAVIILNDDVFIKDERFVETLVQPVFTDPSVGLIGGRIAPVPPQTFVEQTSLLDFHVMERVRSHDGNKHHVFTCNGKVLALSRSFIRALKFPNDLAETGAVDGFLYFSCKKAGFRYRYNPEAVVYFKFASTVSDFLKWTVKDSSMGTLMGRLFGPSASEEYRLRRKYYHCFTLKELVLQFLHVAFLIFLHFYVRRQRKETIRFNPTWDVISSTKNISAQ